MAVIVGDVAFQALVHQVQLLWRARWHDAAAPHLDCNKLTPMNATTKQRVPHSARSRVRILIFQHDQIHGPAWVTRKHQEGLSYRRLKI